MIIRPVTDLRNHFPDIEREVNEVGEVYLTKNGYGSAVLLSLDEYTAIKGAAYIPPDPGPRSDESYRGYFHKYADPELMEHEKEAGELYVLDNWEKYTPEGRDAG